MWFGALSLSFVLTASVRNIAYQGWKSSSMLSAYFLSNARKLSVWPALMMIQSPLPRGPEGRSHCWAVPVAIFSYIKGRAAFYSSLLHFHCQKKPWKSFWLTPFLHTWGNETSRSCVTLPNILPLRSYNPGFGDTDSFSGPSPVLPQLILITCVVVSNSCVTNDPTFNSLKQHVLSHSSSESGIWSGLIVTFWPKVCHEVAVKVLARVAVSSNPHWKNFCF